MKISLVLRQTSNKINVVVSVLAASQLEKMRNLQMKPLRKQDAVFLPVMNKTRKTFCSKEVEQQEMCSFGW